MAYTNEVPCSAPEFIYVGDAPIVQLSVGFEVIPAGLVYRLKKFVHGSGLRSGVPP